MSALTSKRLLVPLLVAAIALPTAASAAAAVAPHPAHQVVARERLVTPRLGQIRVVPTGATVATVTGFAWNDAALGAAVGVAATAMVAAAFARRRANAPTAST